MHKFFEIFGKITLVLLVLGSLTYAGFYFGTKTKGIETPEAVNTEIETIETIEPITTPMVEGITIVGGLSKNVGLSFDQYSVMTSPSWTSKKESQTAMDEKLTLNKDGYEITIFQAATGGALCLYPNDAPFEGPSSKYEVFTNLTTKDNRILRRSLPAGEAGGDKNGLAFTVCQKSPDGSYQQPTNYGHISVKIPANYTAEMLLEIDTTLASLKKI